MEVEAPQTDDGKPPKFDAQGVRSAIMEVLRQVDIADERDDGTASRR